MAPMPGCFIAALVSPDAFFSNFCFTELPAHRAGLARYAPVNMDEAVDQALTEFERLKALYPLVSGLKI